MLFIGNLLRMTTSINQYFSPTMQLLATRSYTSHMAISGDNSQSEWNYEVKQARQQNVRSASNILFWCRAEISCYVAKKWFALHAYKVEGGVKIAICKCKATKYLNLPKVAKVSHTQNYSIKSQKVSWMKTSICRMEPSKTNQTRWGWHHNTFHHPYILCHFANYVLC